MDEAYEVYEERGQMKYTCQSAIVNPRSYVDVHREKHMSYSQFMPMSVSPQ